MSTFYSSSAKVVPECLSSPSRVLITQINTKAMNSPVSPDLLIKPRTLCPSDDLIKPPDDQKIRLDSSLISTNTEGTIRSIPGDTKGDYDRPEAISSELWPKNTELDNHPQSSSVKKGIGQHAYKFPKSSELDDLSPSIKESEFAQMIRELASLYPQQAEMDDRPASPSSFKFEKLPVAIREPANRAEVGANRPLSSPYRNVVQPQMEVITEADYEAEKKSGEDVVERKMQMISEAAYQAFLRDNKLPGMKERNGNSARAKLTRVVEESESFARREFGANALQYMSTHGSASHEANFSTHTSSDYYDFRSKHPSYHHNNHPTFISHKQSSHRPANFTNCKSAPATSALRTGFSFTLFRRGSSEGGKLGDGRRAAYSRPNASRPRSVGRTLLSPLVKIKNRYVGCMMALEDTGDLSGMAQGGTYATRARYFADVPLSKIDPGNLD